MLLRPSSDDGGGKTTGFGVKIGSIGLEVERLLLLLRGGGNGGAMVEATEKAVRDDDDDDCACGAGDGAKVGLRAISAGD